MSRVIVPKSAVELALTQAGRHLRENVDPRLLNEFSQMKTSLLSNFDDHPVTRELELKTGADPSAFTSYGSLFGFIGFNESDEPTRIVREMLEKSELKFIKSKSGRLDFRVFHPSKEELFAATPLPWATGRSWLRGIESGMSGFGRYLNIENEASRAGKGIQAKNKLRSTRFKPTKYISKILNDFIQKIEKLSL